MSSEDEDIVDEAIDEYSYTQGDSQSSYQIEDKKSSEQIYQQEPIQTNTTPSGHQSPEKEDSHSSKQFKQDESDIRNKKYADDDLVQVCLLKAVKFNNLLLKQRKSMKQQFKQYEKNRTNLKDMEMPYQTAHFPLYLKTSDKFVVLPSQNLTVRRGTIEQFVKMNVENENQVKKQEMERRITIKQRKPYQRRRVDPV